MIGWFAALGAIRTGAEQLPVTHPTGQLVTGVLTVEKTDFGRRARDHFDRASIRKTCAEASKDLVVVVDPTFGDGQEQDGTGEDIAFRTPDRLVSLSVTHYYQVKITRPRQHPLCCPWQLRSARTLRLWRYEGGNTTQQEIDLDTGVVRELTLPGRQSPFTTPKGPPTNVSPTSDGHETIAGYRCERHAYPGGPFAVDSCLLADNRLARDLQRFALRTTTYLPIDPQGYVSRREVVELDPRATMDMGVFQLPSTAHR